MSETPGYEESIQEIESIIRSLEKGEPKIDDLANMVKRASFLLKNCQDKLRHIEKEIGDITDNPS